MRRLIAIGIALGSLVAGSPAAAQNADAEPTVNPHYDSSTVAGSYWTFGGLYYANDNNYDLLAFAGQSWPFGNHGRWTLRAGLGAGVSFWGYNDAGLMGGVQAGLERVLTGDMIQLRDGQPLEIYALLGGSAYAGRNLVEKPGETALVPAASAGLGVRWRGGKPSDPMVRLELYHEERFSDFGSRLFIRFDYLTPRGIIPPPATPPSPAQP